MINKAIAKLSIGPEVSGGGGGGGGANKYEDENTKTPVAAILIIFFINLLFTVTIKHAQWLFCHYPSIVITK